MANDAKRPTDGGDTGTSDLDAGRRGFLKGALAAGGAAASLLTPVLSSIASAQAQPGMVPGTKNHYYVPATDRTVHWGYFSKLLAPQVEVSSGDFVTIEALTHHANDDAERMVKGDPGAESEKSSVDLAMRDAFRKMRRFLMTTKGLSEDEAISLMSVAVDFGVTQVVDGNWGVHAIIKKSLFAGA